MQAAQQHRQTHLGPGCCCAPCLYCSQGLAARGAYAARAHPLPAGPPGSAEEGGIQWGTAAHCFAMAAKVQYFAMAAEAHNFAVAGQAHSFAIALLVAPAPSEGALGLVKRRLWLCRRRATAWGGHNHWEEDWAKAAAAIVSAVAVPPAAAAAHAVGGLCWQSRGRIVGKWQKALAASPASAVAAAKAFCCGVRDTRSSGGASSCSAVHNIWIARWGPQGWCCGHSAALWPGAPAWLRAGEKAVQLRALQGACCEGWWPQAPWCGAPGQQHMRDRWEGCGVVRGVHTRRAVGRYVEGTAGMAAAEERGGLPWGTGTGRSGEERRVEAEGDAVLAAGMGGLLLLLLLQALADWRAVCCDTRWTCADARRTHSQGASRSDSGQVSMEQWCKARSRQC
eukprot:scaffold114474_cov16-Tisochrysis_lutea.AAC.3